MLLSCEAVDIKCEFKYHNWAIIDRVYQCNVTSLEITAENHTISNVLGAHDKGKSNHHVLGFHIFGKKCFYFPDNIHKIFTNLEGIVIGFGGLKHISNTDLKKHPRLQILMLPNNEIEVLEKDLFKFNPLLKAFVVNHNKIKHIDPKLFSMKTLSKIFLYKNTCIDSVAVSKEQKEELEAAVKENCPPKVEITDQPVVVTETHLRFELIEGKITELEKNVLKKFDVLFKQLKSIEKTMVVKHEKDVEKDVQKNVLPEIVKNGTM